MISLIAELGSVDFHGNADEALFLPSSIARERPSDAEMLLLVEKVSSFLQPPSS